VRSWELAAERGANPIRHLAAARSLQAIVARARPDLVHVHMGAPTFTAALARRRGWPPVVATIHGLNLTSGGGAGRRLLGLAEVLALRAMDEVWVINSEDAALLARFGIAARCATSCGVGCRLDRFDHSLVKDRAELGRATGLDEEHFVFAYVGRFVDFKGYPQAVQTFLEVHRRCPRARLLVAGATDPQHPTGLSLPEEQAVAGHPGIVRAGWRLDVWSCLALADCLVFPSRREGIPVAPMEALAMGVPVIARDTRGSRDVVRHGIDGLLLDEHATAADFAVAMERLIAEPDLVARLAAGALAGRERFDRRRFVAEQLSIYRRYAEARKS
jgi:glycosyltransferase involved in cell wall biosynthesis